MKHLILAAASAAAVVVAAPAFAQSTTVTFDGSTDTSTYASQGLVIGQGFSIENNTFGGAVDVPSTPNYLSVGGGSPTLTFRDPVTGQATTTNGFGFTIAGLNAGGGYYAGATLSFLDALGVQIGTQTFAPVGPNEFRSQVQYATTLNGISSVVFNRIENSTGPALFPIDNVTFNLNAVSSAVPEPASWALLIVGFGAVGATMRRRSAVRTRVAFV